MLFLLDRGPSFVLLRFLFFKLDRGPVFVLCRFVFFKTGLGPLFCSFAVFVFILDRGPIFVLLTSLAVFFSWIGVPFLFFGFFFWLLFLEQEPFFTFVVFARKEKWPQRPTHYES